MDLNFYSELTDGSGQSVDSEFLDTQGYSGYSESKFPGGNDSYLIGGGGHPFLSAEHTFHTPSLGDEVFEIPPISLDPDPVVSHYGELSEGAGGSSVSSGLVNNPVVGANDPSFASTYVTPGSQGLEHLSLGVMNQTGGGALLSSSALELSSSIGSHFSSSSPMTIDINHGLLGGSQLSTINQSELGLSLGGGNLLSRSKSPEQPLSATPSPASSLQVDDMDDFRKSVLVDSPVSFSSPAVLAHMTSVPAATTTSVSLATARKGGAKPAAAAPAVTPKGGKRGKQKKDPNEPQKPVSAYALFFKDTQSAIKGQNPNATFGEVSKIVASMWDSLGDDQKQVYKRKTEAAKKEYLKALAAYRASQLSQASSEVMDSAPSPPPPSAPPAPPPPTVPHASRQTQYNPEENTITNICASNIILDVPERITRSHTMAAKPAVSTPPPPTPTVTKIIISKQMLQGGGQLVTVLPAALAQAASRQPPPLQQMQGAPPPPRLQQMAPAPPPLLAKPREGGAAQGPSVPTATQPPPLQIKIVPASLQGGAEATPIIVTTAASVVSTAAKASQGGTSLALQVAPPDGAEEEELASGEVEMELNMPSDDFAASVNVCIRAGCNNPAIESDDWDKEYCSNECVATHCKDIFMAWCSIRNQNMAAVK